MSSRTILIAIVIAAMAVVLAFLGYKSRKTKVFPIIEVSLSEQSRIILIDSMSEEQLKDAITEFVQMYSTSGEVETPNILKEGEGYRLVFSSSVDFELFCWWVNYLVFSDKSKQEIYSVRGWYPFGEVTRDGQKYEFSDKTILLYIPKDDELYDDIYMISPEGKHYQWRFDSNVKEIASRGEKYQDIPNTL